MVLAASARRRQLDGSLGDLARNAGGGMTLRQHSLRGQPHGDVLEYADAIPLNGLSGKKGVKTLRA